MKIVSKSGLQPLIAIPYFLTFFLVDNEEVFSKTAFWLLAILYRDRQLLRIHYE